MSLRVKQLSAGVEVPGGLKIKYQFICLIFDCKIAYTRVGLYIMRDSTVLVRAVSSAWREASSCPCFFTMEVKMLC